MKKKTYSAWIIDDDGTSHIISVVLQEDILLQYCVAYDANDDKTRSAIESVAIANEDIESAILGLYLRFDSHEDFTPQLLALRYQLSSKM